jgi:sulfite exporter TauE/SafE/copper chaperone CopZ
MTCVSCQNRIERKLERTAGVEKAEVSYTEGTAAITYDKDIISIQEIAAVIRRLDYEVVTGSQKQQPDTNRAVGFLIIIAALYFLLQRSGVLNLLVPSQLAEAGMGYGMLFVIGLITSVHCVAMCGGINLSQSIPQYNESIKKRDPFAAFRPTFLYNLGRVISYTAIGFVAGALGSAVTFSATLQGALKLIAGAFMILMGINMLGIFPWLRKLNPKMPKIFAQTIRQKKSGSKSPLYVGLLNGLMPCGPLQAMQIYALSTGSALAGAASMLLFSLGTVPLMLGLGALISALGKKFTKNVMAAGAVLVVVLGLSMLSQGFSLSGLSLSSLIPGNTFARTDDPAASRIENGIQIKSGVPIENDIQIENGVQIINSVLAPGRFPAITVQAGIPVKWIIDAPKGSINGCNNRIFIPEYSIEHQFQTGENIIEFTPASTGKFPYSCWMGMIRSSITVLEGGNENNPAPAALAYDGAGVICHGK